MGLDKEKMPESSPMRKTSNFCFTCRKLGVTSAIPSPFPASIPWKTARFFWDLPENSAPDPQTPHVFLHLRLSLNTVS